MIDTLKNILPHNYYDRTKQHTSSSAGSPEYSGSQVTVYQPVSTLSTQNQRAIAAAHPVKFRFIYSKTVEGLTIVNGAKP